MEIHGTIKNAWRDTWGAVDGNGTVTVVCGHIFGDTKNRFHDGQSIHTSAVLEELPDNIIRTRNSIYKVEWKS